MKKKGIANINKQNDHKFKKNLRDNYELGIEYYREVENKKKIKV